MSLIGAICRNPRRHALTGSHSYLVFGSRLLARDVWGDYTRIDSAASVNFSIRFANNWETLAMRVNDKSHAYPYSILLYTSEQKVQV
jgi:hypothetical protein